MKCPAQGLAQTRPTGSVCVRKAGFGRACRCCLGPRHGGISGSGERGSSRGLSCGENVMRLLFRMMISAAVKAVVAREIWAQPMSQCPWSLLCEFLSPKLGKPLPLCCISPGSFPRAALLSWIRWLRRPWDLLPGRSFRPKESRCWQGFPHKTGMDGSQRAGVRAERGQLVSVRNRDAPFGGVFRHLPGARRALTLC